MFVIVTTYSEWDPQTETSTMRVGVVYGPFYTKIGAMQAKNDLDFPSPEWVEIRQVHQP